MRRRKLIGRILGASAILAVPLAASGKALARNRVETPPYRVISLHDGFEVRRYESRIVAEVTVDGSPRQASNRGFRILANFIFGANRNASSIEMTAPVDRRPASSTIAMTAPVDRRRSGKSWVITFTMPSEYNLRTLPVPTDDRISIREVPAMLMVATRFGGAPSEDVVEERRIEMLAAVDAAGYRVLGPASYARYDPPWTPPFLRRNELLTPVEVK